jgi:15-cis-phytoene synthase
MQQSQAITRKSASNLALAFILLPKEKQIAMSALYAFCREVDDVTDEETRSTEERRASLAAWREDVRRACENDSPKFGVNQELQPVIQRFGLRFGLFDELIQGCEMDLETLRYQTHQELDLYCHRVASVVGLLSIEIFGYSNPGTRDYAIHLGKALQLTNILRDVKNDAARGRIYLPLEELRSAGVSEAELLAGNYSERYERLARNIAARAENFYQLAAAALPAEDRAAMVSAEMMGCVYWRLLRKLKNARFNVFTDATIRLTRPHKLALILRSWLRHMIGSQASDYGAR